MSKPEIGVYLPQMGFTYEQILHRAQRCDDLGIDSLWLYDHLYGPGAPDYPSMEAWTLATALLSRTKRIQVGHMVLCNQFRHPAVLAKMATTLDQISAGRLQLGIGSGSIEDEHDRAGLEWGTFRERSERLSETLEILHQAFANEVIDFTGTHFTVRDMPIKPGPVQQPNPRPGPSLGPSQRPGPTPRAQLTPLSPPLRAARFALAPLWPSEHARPAHLKASTVTPAASRPALTDSAIATAPGESPCTQTDSASIATTVPSTATTCPSVTIRTTRRPTSSASCSRAPGSLRGTSVPSAV